MICCIAGMHRSGTSLMARWLAQSALPLPVCSYREQFPMDTLILSTKQSAMDSRRVRKQVHTFPGVELPEFSAILDVGRLQESPPSLRKLCLAAGCKSLEERLQNLTVQGRERDD